MGERAGFPAVRPEQGFLAHRRPALGITTRSYGAGSAACAFFMLANLTLSAPIRA
jgi:hypothetical protein